MPSDATQGNCVIVYTTEDDQYPRVRLASVEHAREHGCAIILFAADAASVWSDPMPNEWASEGEDRRFGQRLNPADLDFLGRNAIATQVREAQIAGIQAFGWLPKDHGVQVFAEYATAQGAHHVFIPDGLASLNDLRLAIPEIGIDAVAREDPGT